MEERKTAVNTSFEIGQIVKIKVKHPRGVTHFDTKGQLGVVAEIDKMSTEIFYRVHTEDHTSFLYSAEEIRLANNSEIRDKFSDMLMLSYLHSVAKEAV